MRYWSRKVWSPWPSRRAGSVFVIKGLWLDPYTGRIFTDPSELGRGPPGPIEGSAFIRRKELEPGKETEIRQLSTEWRSPHSSLQGGRIEAKERKTLRNGYRPNKAYQKVYIRIWIEIKKQWGLGFDSREKKSHSKPSRGNLICDPAGIVRKRTIPFIQKHWSYVTLGIQKVEV